VNARHSAANFGVEYSGVEYSALNTYRVEYLRFTNGCRLDLGPATPVTRVLPFKTGLFWNATPLKTKREQGVQKRQWKVEKCPLFKGLMLDSLSWIHSLFIVLFKRIFKSTP
jgi:hypothetical protein